MLQARSSPCRRHLRSHLGYHCLCWKEPSRGATVSDKHLEVLRRVSDKNHVAGTFTHVESTSAGLAGRTVIAGTKRRAASGRSAAGMPSSWVVEERIGPGVEHRRLGRQWEGAKDDCRSVDSLLVERVDRRGLDLRLAGPAGQPAQREPAHPRLCEQTLPPSCVPSTPCGSP